MKGPPREDQALWGWAMYDFANSGYTTVVLTAVYNAYFVGIVAAGLGTGRATLLWSLALGLSNALVILSAPLIGAIADAYGLKKPFLAVSTGVCVIATAMLAVTQAGSVGLAMALVVVSNLAFATGENLISAFLPELAPQERIGRVSAFGWSLGYLGGIVILALCLVGVSLASRSGMAAHGAMAIAMGTVALCYGLASLPTFLWVPERGRRVTDEPGSVLRAGIGRLVRTARELAGFSDLRWFLASAFAYACGTFTVIVMASVFAQEVFGFGTREAMGLILVLNVAAALGALGFGQVQDRLGSVKAMGLSLSLWVVALLGAYSASSRTAFWVAALGVGLALGGSQSVGRALMGLLAPAGRLAEFYGLWGMTLRLAALVGPVSYGAIAALTGGDLRLGLLSTAAYFLAGLVLVTRVDERRGKARREAG